MHRLQRLHRVHFEQLRAHRGAPALSLYLPTEDRDAAEQAADLTRLVQTAEEHLEAKGVERSERQRLLAPLREGALDIPFWTSWSMPNLTVFAHDGQHMFLRSPYRVEPRVSVGERYYLLPLLPILREDFHFYLLGLTGAGRRLYSGDLYHLRELSPQELPAGLRSLRELSPGLAGFAAGRPVVVAGPEGLRAELALPSVHRLDMAGAAPDCLAQAAWTRLRQGLDAERDLVVARCAEGLDADHILEMAAAGQVEALLLSEPSELANQVALAVLDAGGQVFPGSGGPLRAVLRAPLPAGR